MKTLVAKQFAVDADAFCTKDFFGASLEHYVGFEAIAMRYC